MQTFRFVECTHIPTTCPLEISQDNFLLLAVLFMKRTGCVRLLSYLQILEVAWQGSVYKFFDKKSRAKLGNT